MRWHCRGQPMPGRRHHDDARLWIRSATIPGPTPQELRPRMTRMLDERVTQRAVPVDVNRDCTVFGANPRSSRKRRKATPNNCQPRRPGSRRSPQAFGVAERAREGPYRRSVGHCPVRRSSTDPWTFTQDWPTRNTQLRNPRHPAIYLTRETPQRRPQHLVTIPVLIGSKFVRVAAWTKRAECALGEGSEPCVRRFF